MITSPKPSLPVLRGYQSWIQNLSDSFFPSDRSKSLQGSTTHPAHILSARISSDFPLLLDFSNGNSKDPEGKQKLEARAFQDYKQKQSFDKTA